MTDRSPPLRCRWHPRRRRRRRRPWATRRPASAPGGRVTVPYRPRAGDTWQVGGRAPRALPAGTATGRALIPSSAGAATPPQPAPASAAPAPSDAPVDAPSNDTSPPPVADDASARLPAPTADAALDATHLRRQVMGFLPYWEVSDAVLDYNLL